MATGTGSHFTAAESDNSTSDPTSVQEFVARVATASSELAFHATGDTGVRGFLSMVGKVAHDRWAEAKAEYAALKQVDSNKA